MTAFETARLRCQSLTLEDYATFEAGNKPNWTGFTNPYNHLLEEPTPLPFRIPRVKANPEFAEIAIILAISKDRNEVVGSAGFHDFPDENGMIEIGYGIAPEMQNQGFGTELLLGMWKLICARTDVKILRYTVSPDNAPSLHLVRKLGFTEIGVQIDPEDGPELIFEMAKEEFLSK
jgi:[ribosomal protein S5]-alanine N-acetyltransferase